MRCYLWGHPEWWIVALCVLAWSAMLLAGWRNGGHAQHRTGFLQEMPSWILMVAAMMFPLILPSVRVVAADSLWRRRQLAMAEFLAGYLLPWLALGLAAFGLRQQSWARTDWTAALLFGVAALWQRTRLHQRALIACCQRLPLAPLGWRADFDCLRFGANIGMACMATCWPLMLGCAFTGHSSIAMAGGLVVGASERWYYRPRTRRMLVVTVGLALYYAGMAGLGSGSVLALPQGSAPEIVGQTGAPFTIEKDQAQITLTVHRPEDPGLLRAGTNRRVFLNVEKMTSDEWAGTYDVYLNLPQDEKPDVHSAFYAGPLPMFGLEEASRTDGKHEAQGLYKHLEVTDLYNRLAGMPGWDPTRLHITFAARTPGSGGKIQVGRVSLSMAPR
jgi:hypothetical protein